MARAIEKAPPPVGNRVKHVYLFLVLSGIIYWEIYSKH